MSLIAVNDLTFVYEGSYDPVFEGLSFRIDTDWKLGFVGRNGRGKTTLLKLMMGEYPYTGSIASSAQFEYFPYPVSDKGRRTLDVLEEICPFLPYWKLARELSKLQMDEETLNRPFDTLSNGEQTKALLAVMFLKENSFLLIDEPTNHLDAVGRALVSSYLNTKKGFIVVSHDRAFLDGCIDHVLSINRAGIEIQQGNFSSWMENRRRQDSFELAENERLKKDIRRMEKAARQSKEWADKVESTKIGRCEHRDKYNECGGRAYIGEQSRRMQQRRKNLERRQQAAIGEKKGMLQNIEKSDSLKITQTDYHANCLVRLKDVAITYGSHAVCSGVTFSIEKGDRVALCGVNGSGKSSIIKLILGDTIPYTGTVETGSRLHISYVPQDAGFLAGNLAGYAMQRGIDETLFKTILRKLDFKRVQFEKDMQDFSMGQKKKVLIAASLCEKAHLHIWDEPMNYIDVISRMQIEDLLTAFQPTLLFVEHDRVFTEKIATKTIQL